ncbi:MAG: trypsin-like serine peptidase [Gammaproteobacteria bacterium]
MDPLNWRMPFCTIILLCISVDCVYAEKPHPAAIDMQAIEREVIDQYGNEVLENRDLLDQLILRKILKKAPSAPMPPANPNLSVPLNHNPTLRHFDPKTGQENDLDAPTPTAPDNDNGAKELPPNKGSAPEEDSPDQEGSPHSTLEQNLVITPVPPAPLLDTTGLPWRTITKLLMRFNVAGSDYYYVCSGATINQFLVYTAGHCIYNHSPDGLNNARWAAEVWVWPGQTDRVWPTLLSNPDSITDEDWPYGVAKMTWLRTYTAWINSEDLNFDFAWITIDRRIGNRVGWMGVSSGTGSALNLGGYPAERPYVPVAENRLYRGFDPNNVISYTSNRIQLDAYVYGGHSGGPAWLFDGANSYIHGVHSTSDRVGYAEETRVTNDVISNTNTFVADDEVNRPPANRPELIEYVISDTAKDLLTNTVIQGNSIDVEYNGYNVGFVRTTATVDFYLSTDSLISRSDYYIGARTIDLDANFHFNFNTTLTVPASVPPNNYYVGWILNSSGIEYNTENNSVVIGPETLTVNPAPPPPPPLPPNPTALSQNPQLGCTGSACRVPIQCNGVFGSGTSCNIAVKIFVPASVLRFGDDPAAKAQGRLLFASGVATVPAGQSASMRLKLRKAGRQIVRTSTRRRIRGVMEIRNSTGAVSSTGIRVRLP